MNYLIWFVLFIVAVSDAREHRIPNYLLLTILILSAVDKIIYSPDLSFLFYSFLTGITCFIASLLLYFLRVMAPGDVKLLGVIGFWVGSEHIVGTVYWIGVSSVVVGLLYGLLRLADSPGQFKTLVNKYTMLAQFGASGAKTLQTKKKMSEHYRMPFAPVVVIGLAMHFYFLN
ncbi:prepilin peptidase [Vibrio aquaticus]|uniref:Prepilin peptidase n=1 Tax=Vibrio aquaticus TaxID=2496559 RepID=A0A3S0N4M0_9VIBR|nr:A24 family peptidase [Vibrio aquaticus]RTZ15225.1 prepilin peptidase [Vibrio aquaticus]